jgi:UDP-N-acetylmuramate--alanine ligase
MKISLDKVEKVHFIGICGIGISAVARLLKTTGKEVSGSDVKSSPICDNLKEIGIKMYIGHSEENIYEAIDLVIYTPAIPDNNLELEKATRIGIKTINYPQALGLIFNDKIGIAVCGTHGKSTTTAMIGLILDGAKLDPTIAIGSIVPRYNSNLRIGKSQYFVVEACDDYYSDIDDLKTAFTEFVSNLPHDGILICNGDDTNINDLNSEINILAISCTDDRQNLSRGGNDGRIL